MDAVGLIWTISLGGATLAEPATLSLPFDGSALPPGASPSSLILAYQGSDGTWISVPATVDASHSIVTAQVLHLSVWSLFTINWDYWLAFIAKAASANLTDLLSATTTLTSACVTSAPSTKPIYTVDNGASNGMIQGCLTSSTKSNATISVTNLRAFPLELFGDALGSASGSLLDAGDSVSFGVGGAKEVQPVIVAADLDALGLGYRITDITLRLLPGSELLTASGQYSKILTEIVKAEGTLWTATTILDDLKAGNVQAAAEATVQLITGKTYLTILAQALQRVGVEFGFPELASISLAQLQKVMTVVNLLDLVVTVWTWDIQYLITAHSEVHVRWLTAPAAPASVAVSYAETPALQVVPTVSWIEPSTSVVVGFRVYLYELVIGECLIPGCPPAPKCLSAPTLPKDSSAGGLGPWFVGAAGPSAHSFSFEPLPETPTIFCGAWVVAYNAVGASRPGVRLP